MIPLGTKIELDGSSFLRERRIQGSSMGSNHFRVDMPRYIDFYLQGRLKLDELVTRRLQLDDINDAFKYMKEGSVARSVMVFDQKTGRRTKMLCSTRRNTIRCPF